ncbi:pilus assembly protein [Aliidiomarina haloalkalitolerans]|uniref:Pilus assembly protein n=1 Tax=Aliidiomarina haloalkalitolerans TaxID=859059 RepID=A0A432VZ79_9GAMM|nr:pilus assembly protein [Aliidiomarina haloalkalitolerans]RUO21965.1 pilus assembly protein [Aliidiomarina haloalkalitolerans]
MSKNHALSHSVRPQRYSKAARYARGQGMTEYIVVLALVVVAAIGVYSFFGKTVRTQMAGVAKEISGQPADQQIRQAEQAANTASSTANQNYGLGNYDEGTHSGN